MIRKKNINNNKIRLETMWLLVCYIVSPFACFVLLVCDCLLGFVGCIPPPPPPHHPPTQVQSFTMKWNTEWFACCSGFTSSKAERCCSFASIVHPQQSKGDRSEKYHCTKLISQVMHNTHISVTCFSHNFSMETNNLPIIFLFYSFFFT